MASGSASGITREQLDTMSAEGLKVYILQHHLHSVARSIPKRKRRSNPESEENVEEPTVSTGSGKATEGGEEEDGGVDAGPDGRQNDGEEELEAKYLDKLIAVSACAAC